MFLFMTQLEMTLYDTDAPRPISLPRRRRPKRIISIRLTRL